MNEFFATLATYATAGGNAGFVGAAGALAVAAAYQRRRRIIEKDLTPFGSQFLVGVFIAALGVLIRIGQWFAAQVAPHFPGPNGAGTGYHPMIWLVRDELTVVAVCLFSIGAGLAACAAVRRGTIVGWLIWSIGWVVILWIVGAYLAKWAETAAMG